MNKHAKTMRALEGTWAFETLEIDGTVIPASALAQSRLLIDGDRFRTESPEATYDGIFTINLETTPHQIDIHFIEGPEAGNWSYGIFDLRDDQVTFCLTVVGTTRPVSFATQPHSGYALETLRRADSSRPNDIAGGNPNKIESEPAATSPRDTTLFSETTGPILDLLQGDWFAVNIVRDGMTLPPSFLKTARREGIGNRVKVSFGKKVMIDALVRIDDQKSPIWIDYLLHDGSIQLGIFRWNEEDAEVCFGAPGKARPAEFAAPPGSEATLSQWRRSQVP